MDYLAPPIDAALGPERQRKGKWKRAAQVCTNCRSLKVRCDFQERFPEPCSRCASMGDSNSRPCHVDSSHKRTIKDSSRRSPTLPSPISTVSPGDERQDGPSRSTTAPLLTDIPSPAEPNQLLSSRSDDAKSPPSLSTQTARQIGEVYFTGDEVTACFEEYFTYYHPFIPILPGPQSPDALFASCELLFWVLCVVACRPRADHPLARARTLGHYLALTREVKGLLAQLMVTPCYSFHVVQALIIICEYPFAMSRGRENLAWFYSGFALHLGLQLGLHRPHFATEFDYTGDISPEELNERTLTWVHTFIVHQNIATKLGLPSGLADDWVTTSASHPHAHPADPLLALAPDVVKLLRIQRFVQRLCSQLGHTPSTTGRRPAAVARALIGQLGAELAELENALAPMTSRVAVALLEAKLQLYTFELQDEQLLAREGDGAGAEGDLVTCYTSSIRMLELMNAFDRVPATRAIFWSTSIYTSSMVATLCLLKLASLESPLRTTLNIDKEVVFKEVSHAFTIMKTRSMYPGDAYDRILCGFKYLTSRDLFPPSAPPAGHGHGHPHRARPAVAVRSRMSLAGLIHDMVLRVRAIMSTYTPVPAVPLPVPYPPEDALLLVGAGAGAGAGAVGAGCPPAPAAEQAPAQGATDAYLALTPGVSGPETGPGPGPDGGAFEFDWLQDLAAGNYSEFFSGFDFGALGVDIGGGVGGGPFELGSGLADGMESGLDGAGNEGDAE